MDVFAGEITEREFRKSSAFRNLLYENTGHPTRLSFNHWREETMSLSANKKKGIISDYQMHEKDTGSSEVQIALLTQQIGRA